MNKRATETNLNNEEFEQLKEAYVSTIVDSMSMKDFVQYVSNDMQDFLDEMLSTITENREGKIE